MVDLKNYKLICFVILIAITYTLGSGSVIEYTGNYLYINNPGSTSTTQTVFNFGEELNKPSKFMKI
jgi:hypothetical protein